MSRIDELIQQLCPDGVEYKTLGDIMQIRRGASPRPIQNYITNQEDGIPWIKIGDVDPRSKFIIKTNQKITTSGAKKSCYLKKGDFILSNSMSFGRPYILGIDGCIHDGWIAMSNFKNYFHSDFLYYLLRSEEVQKYWKQKASSGTVQNLNSDIVRDTVVPVPPLPVQEEIVRILDKFTALEAELEAELEARRKQYKYYRDQLLTFGDEVEWKPLGEVCVNASNIRWSENQDQLFRYIDLSSVDRDSHKITNASEITFETAPSRAQQIVQENDILFGTTRPLLKRFCIISPKYSGQICSTGFCVLRPKQKVVLSQWIYHQISLQRFYDYVEKHQKGASYPAIADKDVKLYKIPVPPLAEQERIVRILDKFDALVNDISSGLPAELEMRRKQYEYYRDKLLTFKPIAKEA